jgi:hypothetical protein
LNDAAICRALSRRCQLSKSVLRPLLPTAQTAYQAGMGGIQSDLRTTFLRLDSMAILHTSRIVAADGGQKPGSSDNGAAFGDSRLYYTPEH